MIDRIRHNSPSPIQCLRAFHILFLAYLLFRCYCYYHYKTKKYYFCYPLPLLSYYFATKYFATDIKFLGVVELTTQLLIFENILWLLLCRINKCGLNTLSSKTVAIPGRTYAQVGVRDPARMYTYMVVFSFLHTGRCTYVYMLCARLYYDTCAPLHPPVYMYVHVRDQNDNATYASTR